MKNLIRNLIGLTMVLQLLFTSCIKEKDKTTTTETIYEQEEFVPENGGNGTGVGFCQCVAYIKHQLGITTGTADALNWGITYTPKDYTLITGLPQAQDIVVIPPAFGGVNTKYGHIGFVNEISNINGDNFSINIISANYNTTNTFTSCNCNNVNLEQNVSVTANNRNNIRFYRNTSKTLNCPDFTNTPNPTRIINLSGSLNFGNVIIGNSQTKPLTITNNGNSDLAISSLSIPNGYTTDYNSGSLPAGNSTTANITFSPQNMVTNYNGNVIVNCNSTNGTNSISISGNGINGTPSAPTFSPSQGAFTSCSFSDQIGSGNCTGSTYLGGIIHMKVASYDQQTNTINFTIEKCSNSFQNSGTAYIKSGDYCGSVVNQTSYGVGASSISLSVSPPVASGSYTYTAILVSATTDKFYSLSINVQY